MLNCDKSYKIHTLEALTLNFSYEKCSGGLSIVLNRDKSYKIHMKSDPGPLNCVKS